MVNIDKKTLLLVEDEIILAMSKQKDLKTYGYIVLITNTGEKAVNLCKENSNIDLILMDIDLGKGIDGTKAAELILKEKDIPVVFLSSHTEPEIVEKTENITSYGYVVKSASITVLNTSIKMAFKLFEAHKKIDDSEKRYRELYENSPLGYQSLSNEGNFVEVNPALCKLLGYKKEELLNEWFGKILTPESIKTLKINFPIFKKTGEIHQIQFNFITKKGEIIPVEIEGNASYDKNGHFKQTHCIIRDISNRQKMEEQLRNERDNLRNIFDTMVDGVYIVNEKLDIQYINPVLIKDFGDYKGLKCYKYFYNRDERCPWCKYNEILEGKTVRWVKEFPKIEKIFDFIETPISNTDGTISKLKIFRDITDQKNAENEIKRQLLEKETILKEVHHRIKNNFSSIGNLLSLQIDSLSNQEAISALQDAIGRIQSMKILYEKLLITSEYNVTSIKEYLLNLLEEIFNLFPNSKNITVDNKIDDFQLDSKQLVPVGIIVNELITNILKHAFPGKDSGIIKVLLDNKSGKINLSISDNGIGLPEGFELDKQTGFGLMLVKMLSEQLNGTFSIENYNGTKSTLEFYI